MNNNYTNIYNNLIKLTRNKNLYLKLKKKDTFSDRLIILLFHFGFFLKYYKSDISKKESQKLFDFLFRQIELSIREIGYGDVIVNKKMKSYINLFYSIIEKIELWDKSKNLDKQLFLKSYLNIDNNFEFYVNYFDKYRSFLLKNTLNIFLKDIISHKF